jgi:hypothetical protein
MVAALFLLPDARSHLISAMKFSDPAVARWAYCTAMRLVEGDRAAFIWLALDHLDSVVRLRAAITVREWRNSPDREKFLARMTTDRFMPVRREALYAMVEASSEARRVYLQMTLLDRHRSMREAARYYIRQDVERSGVEFDFRKYYLDVLSSNLSDSLAAAIAGLGECGDKRDGDMLTRYVVGQKTPVATAAVGAVARLNRESRVSWYVALLLDERPAVARAAARALSFCGSAELPVVQLREIVRTARHIHSRRFALRLLLHRHLFDAVVDAITVAGGDDAALAGAAAEFIERAMQWRIPYGPSDTQKTAVVAALAALPRPLPEKTLKRVREITGISLM